MRKELITGLAVAALLAGCVTTRGESTRSAIDAALQESTLPPVAPNEVADAMMPDVGVDLPEGGEERFDVNTDATPAKAFFMALVEGTPYNMVVHPQVAGRISLTMKSVTVPEVLDVISDVYGYSYRRTETGFVVLPATIQTRIFQIDYLNLRRTGTSVTSVSSGQINAGSQSGGRGSQSGQQGSAGASGSAGGTGSGAVTQGRRNGGQTTGSGIQTNYEADFWTELKDTLEDIIGGLPDHQVVVNAQAGVVMVRAVPEQLRRVEEYLNAVQSIAQRQVIIEAKIIEVQLNDAYQSGINWVAVAENSDGETFTFGQRTPPTGFGADIDDLGGAPITIEPGTVTTGFETTTLGGAFAMAFDIGDFNSFIELLSTQGDTRVLSSPRVSTLNNQKAVIKAGSDEFFVTDVQSSTVTGTASSTSRDITLTPFFSGIALDVTPQIAADGKIILHIHPTVSEVTDQTKVVTVSGESDTLPLAFSEIREADSIVKAESGQIIVIGGLMRNTSRTSEFGMPILSHIPGIGRLFKSSREVESKTELVILLKPIVADDSSVWTTLADDSLQRIRKMRQ